MAAGFRATRADADALFAEYGKPNLHASADQVFAFVFDEPLDQVTDYLHTVEVGGKVYAVTAPHDGRPEDATISYFSLLDGSQVDFVDGVKKEDDGSAKCDLSDFTGFATLCTYETDDQEEGAYPTGLRLLKRKRIRITGK